MLSNSELLLTNIESRHFAYKSSTTEHRVKKPIEAREEIVSIDENTNETLPFLQSLRWHYDD